MARMVIFTASYPDVSPSRWKFARKGRREGENGRGFSSLLSPSHGPLRFVNSHSLFRALSLYAKNEASEEEVVIVIFLLFSFFFLYFNFVSTVGRKGHDNTSPKHEWMSSPIVTTIMRSIASGMQILWPIFYLILDTLWKSNFHYPNLVAFC